MQAGLSASPGAPANAHLLNSGTVVLRPSRAAYERLLRMMNEEPSVPGMVFPDQDLLAIAYRGKWRPLPWWYNALKPMKACHAEIWDDNRAKILHYILRKPWMGRRGWDEGDVVEGLHALWWDEWARVEGEWRDDGGKKAVWDTFVAELVAKD